MAADKPGKTPIAGTLEGAFDGVHGGSLGGWIWDPANPDRTVMVEVLGSDSYYACLSANDFRSDLKAAGKRNGYCGFKLLLPAELAAHHIDNWAILIDGTADALKPAGGPDQTLIKGWLTEQNPSVQRQLLVQRIYRHLAGTRAPKTELDSALAEFERDPLGATAGLVQRLSAAKQTADVMGITIADAVKAAYLGVLSREPEPLGFEIYGNAIRNGMALQDLIAELVATTEFQNRRGASPGASAMATAELTRLSASIERAVLTLAMGAATTAVAETPFFQTEASRPSA